MRWSSHTSNRAEKRSAGFTILELMIATTVFSVILLVITAGILSFTHDYYKGLVSNNTQLAARSVVNEIGQAIEFNEGSITTPSANGAVQAVCVGNKMYNYLLHHEIGGGWHGITTDNKGCQPAAFKWDDLDSDTRRELLGERMRLSQFSVEQLGNKLYRLHIRVVYGDDDVLSNPADDNAACLSGNGSQFCAVSEITTTVQQRL